MNCENIRIKLKQEISRTVLFATDVDVDGRGWSRAFQVERSLAVGRVEVAQKVPSGIDESVHRVRFSLRRGSAPVHTFRYRFQWIVSLAIS